MFYKNMEHYQNTIRKIVREEYGVELVFADEKYLDILQMLWMTSDRESDYNSGYQFMCWVKHDCDSFESLKNIFKKLHKSTRYCDMDNEVVFDCHCKMLLGQLGLLPEVEVL